MPHAAGPTPFDELWSFLATVTTSIAVLVFTLLSMGQNTLFATDRPLSQTDAKVTVAFFGALACLGGLLTMGIVALRFLASPDAAKGIAFPRFKLLEGEVRRSEIARVGLFVILFLPTMTAFASIFKYVRDSRISCWDAPLPLGSGFLSSRSEALIATCEQSQMFRMAPNDRVVPNAAQWFVWSDPLLLLLIFGAAFVWILYLRRVNW